jgi:hypothetical protein
MRTLWLCLAAVGLLRADAGVVTGSYREGDFRLFYRGAAAEIRVAPEDYKVVHIAAAALARDIERVTGVRPRVADSAAGAGAARSVVLIGTLGHSPAIDRLAAGGKLPLDEIKNQWESFVMAVVRQPLPGVEEALVIAGSDRRGTAFGAFDLSRQIGVSPWTWWADVPPARQTTLAVRAGRYRQGPPSVEYRGIFLNDEDWGLRPWAGKTYDPALGDIGPKTYERIFELLLRLKANLLWPAMHACTQAFNNYPGNKRLADDYAIVMSSSHAEPMLRDNLTEWDSTIRGAWNYQTNAAGVLRYWDERAAENGRFENLYEIGMRGIHDSAMPATGTLAERVALLERIFADQREVLARRVNPDVTRVPQLFCAYKEVLELYRANLKVPDDVTLGWADDNHGYIRQLPDAREQSRRGGSGIYYHASYWGAPHDYLWLNSTPPALIWEEMSKAFACQARKLWVLNVGDLKPAEISTEYFLSMAWDMRRFPEENQRQFLESWAAREFGAPWAPAAAAVMNDYFTLGYARKPEHMGWNLNAGAVNRGEYTPISYGDEAGVRQERYRALERAAQAIYDKLPAERRDAFYELVLYPVHGASLMNQKMIETDRTYLYAMQGRASTAAHANLARQAFVDIERETDIFNNRIAGGKWRNMMSSNPRNLAVFDLPAPAMATLQEIAAWGVAVEGHLKSLSAHPARPFADYSAQIARWGKPNDTAADTLPVFDAFTRRKHFFDLFRGGSIAIEWTAAPDADWVRLSARQGKLGDDQRIWVDIDWAKAPRGETAGAAIHVRGPGGEQVVKLRCFNPDGPALADLPRFVESGGVVSMRAEHFTRRTDRDGAGWRTLPSLGRDGGTVTVWPPTVEPVEYAGGGAGALAKAPSLEYDFYSFGAGKARILLYALPTMPLHEGRRLRYAVAIDDGAPSVVDMQSAGPQEIEDPAEAVPAEGANLDAVHAWERNVLRAAALAVSDATIAAPGKHTLKIWMMDPGVVMDKIVVDFGGLAPSYLGPPETVLP